MHQPRLQMGQIASGMLVLLLRYMEGIEVFPAAGGLSPRRLGFASGGHHALASPVFVPQSKKPWSSMPGRPQPAASRLKNAASVA